MFYTHQGSFEDGSLVIICKDIFPMDLGNATYTEFKMSEDVAAYMADNIELFDCENGLIHSHHTMASTFSGTDMNTLQKEGNDTNCFVSLIVNTSGNYSAKITRKVHTKSEVTVKTLDKSYEFFGEGSKNIVSDSSEATKVIEKTAIEYFDLTVERHEVPNRLEYLDARFDEIQKKKASESNSLFHENIMLTGNRKNDTFFDTWDREPYSSSPIQSSLSDTPKDSFPTHHLTENDSLTIDDVMSCNWTPDSKEIHKAVVHLLTCSMILNPDKIDLKQWVTKQMVKVYKKIFGDDSLHEAKTGASGAFCEWKDFITQFTMDYFDYSSAPDSIMMDSDLAFYKVAEALCAELSQYLSNDYVRAYYEEFSLYLIQ